MVWCSLLKQYLVDIQSTCCGYKMSDTITKHILSSDQYKKNEK